MVALTIGMATYDDYDGVYFTLQSLRLYHDVEDTEFLVIDNFGCDATKTFVESIRGARYIRDTGLVGTAAPRDLVFRRAAGNAVLCLDSHVQLVPGAIARLKQYYRDNPETRDLLQGPLLYDSLDAVSTHFDPVWRTQMWGIWATDPRGVEPDGEPFDIPMQGLGLFSCRRRAWPGFNPAFRLFGGEEGYIHEKFRQRGGRTLCLPWLRWSHRFSRPKGVPYPLTIEAKLRNYVIGHTELGLDITPALEHFAEFLSSEVIESVKEEALRDARMPQARFEKTEKFGAKKRRKAPTPAAEFDEDMARALLDALPDEVRIAYGVQPVAIFDFPASGPERAAARDESRALLLAQGWLVPSDFDGLTVDEAIATARERATRMLTAAGAAPAPAPAPASDTAADDMLARSPPDATRLVYDLRADGSSRTRAIVCFVDDHQDLIQQATALCLSWQYAECADTDLVAMGPRRALDRLPDAMVKIEQRPATDDPVWNGYGYVNSIACMNGAGAELLDRYEYVLRSDVDTFITPAWNAFRPDVFTVGTGGYSNDDDVRCRLRKLAAEYGLTHRGLTNTGSTWYGPTAVVRRASAFAEMLTKRLLTQEFAECEGAWPGWYRGVALLYASEIAVNHCAPDAQRTHLLDFFSTSTESIHRYPHIHCWHTDEKFSKHWFMSQRYSVADRLNLDLDVIRDYCMEMSFASVEALAVLA